ncbi:MAG: hypothetical protein JSV86_03665 [Gemmatimonadota bacterium]|nr:MAG: hypothetical protein JSV86_03665 [Gemmatimonadota bacterium]
MSFAVVAAIGLIVQAVAGDPAGVQVRVALAPDSVRIGERLTLTVSVAGVSGDAEVVFPLLPDTGAITALGPPARDADRGVRSARYELAAWEFGDQILPPAQIRVVTEAAELRIPLPDVSLHVVSILPTEAAVDSLGWKQPSDVLGPNWSLGEKLAALGALLALVMVTFFHVRRRAAVPAVPLPPAKSPRQRALEALARLEASGLVEAGELKGFYAGLSQVLRDFLAGSDAAWSLDLTTTELMELVGRDGVRDAQIRSLGGLLAGADLVKFARRRPSRAQAARALDAARIWLVEFERLVPEPEPAEEAVGDLGFEALAELEAGTLADLDDMFSERAAGDPPGEPEAKAP